MIKIKKLDFAYTKNKKLFENLTMKFNPGSIYGLLGKNGSGKTTMLKLISGLRYPQAGSILIDGIDSRGRLPDYLSKIFLIPEEFDFPSISIDSFIRLYSPFYQNFQDTQFEYYLSEFEVALHSIITKLSLGQKKKFLLAFGLACNTAVLLMDEPTNGLDIPSKVQFRKILASLVDDKRIFIISTHQVKDIEDIIDNISIIDQGKMRFSANLKDISETLVFGDNEELGIGESDIIYKEMQLGTYRIVGKNIFNQNTYPDLELLFNAVINDSEKINKIFDNIKSDNYVTI